MGQLAGMFDPCRDDACGVLVADLCQHDEAGLPFNRRCNIAVVGADDERSGLYLDQFAALASFGMGFMSGGGFRVRVGRITGFSWHQQPVR